MLQQGGKGAKMRAASGAIWDPGSTGGLICMSPLVSLLAEVPLFQLLDADERTALAHMMEQVSFPSGDRIFQEGELGDRMYVVCSGSVELATTDKLGQKLVLTTASRGDLFGELSLLDHGARNAEATVLEDAELLVVDRATLIDFVRRRPEAALDMMAVMGGRVRATTDRLRQMATRNANEEVEIKLTVLERITDAIAAFSGSLAFLGLHAIWFLIWIGLNTIPGLLSFDPFPFGLLTMCVSLEAIFLSVIVLLSQNRQSVKDRIRADVDYEVNLKAELEVSHLHEKVDQLQAALLSRLHQIDVRLRG
jgi:CRP/FNR family transcriptional regulator, cyclic AMP receptor protein